MHKKRNWRINASKWMELGCSIAFHQFLEICRHYSKTSQSVQWAWMISRKKWTNTWKPYLISHWSIAGHLKLKQTQHCTRPSEAREGTCRLPSGPRGDFPGFLDSWIPGFPQEWKQSFDSCVLIAPDFIANNKIFMILLFKRTQGLAFPKMNFTKVTLHRIQFCYMVLHQILIEISLWLNLWFPQQVGPLFYG